MGTLTYAQGIIFLLSVSMLGVSMASRGWSYGNQHPNYTNSPRKIVVGGSANWKFGFNYTDWAFKNGPFFVNDTLVFKYDPPSENNTHPHNVYLLPNLSSFLNCNLSNAQMLANTSDGAGEGFEFVLSKFQPYYIACGAGNGVHCSQGLMKFFVLPLYHWLY